MRTSARRLRITSLLLVTIVATGTTANDVGASSKKTVKAKAATAITIKEFAFKPDKLTGRVGQRISVVNSDRVTHTLSADDKSFNTGKIGGGAKTTFTIAKAGTYKFHCDIHQYMNGTIIVK